jgi:hypothetical protein
LVFANLIYVSLVIALCCLFVAYVNFAQRDWQRTKRQTTVLYAKDHYLASLGSRRRVEREERNK